MSRPAFDVDFGKNTEDLRLPKGDPIVLADGRRIFVKSWKPEWNLNDICHVTLMGMMQDAIPRKDGDLSEDTKEYMRGYLDGIKRAIKDITDTPTGPEWYYTFKNKLNERVRKGEQQS